MSSPGEFFTTPISRFLVLLVIAILAALPGTTSLPPLDRDEARFAQASAQMLETGDWITIRFQDQERNKKPAGIYWLQAASVKVFSSVQAREIWAYRIPSILGAIFASLLTWQIGRTLFNDEVAFLGAVFLATAPALMGEATIAKTDAMLLASICASQLALAKIFISLAHQELTKNPKSSSWITAIIFWLSLTAGIFLKGPIPVLIILLTMIGLLFWPGLENRRAFALQLIRSLKPLTGLVIVIILILPWALSISNATDGRFFEQAIGIDMLGKVVSVQESHVGPPGYHLLLLPILLWPLSAWLFISCRQIWKTKHKAPVWFLIAWTLPTWIIFELTATKLPHYVMPLYPAIALLCAKSVYDMKNTKMHNSPKLWRTGIFLYAIIGLGIGIAFITLPHFLRSNGIQIIDAFHAIILLAGLGLTISMLWRKHFIKGSFMAAGLSFAGSAILLTFILPSLDKINVSKDAAHIVESYGLLPNQTISGQALIDQNSPQSLPIITKVAPVIVLGYSEPSIVFLLGTKTVLSTSPDFAAKALKPTSIPSRRAVLVEKRYEDQFLAALKKENSPAKALAETTGVNYSNGKSVQLTLYALESP